MILKRSRNYKGKCLKCGKIITTGSKSGLCKSCSLKGRKMPQSFKDKRRSIMIGNKIWKGRKHSDISKQKMSENGSRWNKGLKMSLEYRRKLSRLKQGELHPNWQGGISKINKRIRQSLEYRLWRKSVFERDNYTCIWCGARSGNGKLVYLEADHIKPFCDYPELRFAVDNGRTLCRNCHSKTFTYKGHCNKGKKYKTL